MEQLRSTVKRLAFWSVAAVFSLWVLVSLTIAPAFFVAVNSYAVDQDPGSRGLDFDDIEIESDGVTLEGWWIPAEKPIAELIFVHGAGSNRISAYVGSLDFYATLNGLGISVIAMDLRNHGNSPITDARLHMGATEWADVFAAAQWLDTTQPTALPRFALGASMGGSTVIRALHQGLQVTGTILLDPQLGILDSLMHGAQVVTGLPAPLFVLAAQAAIWQYDLPTGSHSPLTHAAALQQPILLLQDWDDPVTRSHYAEALADQNPQVQLKKVPHIAPSDPCIRGRGNWGSHAASHPCHPTWTRQQIATFINERINQQSNERINERSNDRLADTSLSQ
jgi:pimeloyl-ACP methyl ester carboxylesterase